MIYVTKFRVNDLNPSKGKQIEFNIGVVKNFFHFSTDQEFAEFKCYSLADSSIVQTIKVSFTKSPARGDYKIYQNDDGSMDLKDFFLNVLHLTKERNQDDYYAIRKTSINKYNLHYIPKSQIFSSVFNVVIADQVIYMDRDTIGQNSENDNHAAQTIYYGCPGTGKSYEVKSIAEGVADNDGHKDGWRTIWYERTAPYAKVEGYIDDDRKKSLSNNIFRTTFHPDYDYATFVGTYKPVKNGEHFDYQFVPQVFTNSYVAAYRHKDDPIYLIIEEINRGNCAQIFGDLFQLLDRTNGVSDYPIKPDTELAKYLESLKDVPYEELKLPANLHIYATMNTSDQSLFPMDSAFKRRWAMKYMPIKYKHPIASKFNITIAKREYPWLDFLKMVNEMILEATSSEDKQMGEFFIKSSVKEEEFINKVMFYLWNDVCKDLYHPNHVSSTYFMRIVSPKQDEKEHFTFAELFGPRNDASRLLVGFWNHLRKKYLDKHPDADIPLAQAESVEPADSASTDTQKNI